MTGRIQRLLPNKGYGFIVGADSRAHFFLARDVSPRIDFDLAYEGQRVEFEPVMTARGLRAEQVRLDGGVKCHGGGVAIACLVSHATTTSPTD